MWDPSSEVVDKRNIDALCGNYYNRSTYVELSIHEFYSRTMHEKSKAWF